MALTESKSSPWIFAKTLYMKRNWNKNYGTKLFYLNQCYTVTNQTWVFKSSLNIFKFVYGTKMTWTIFYGWGILRFTTNDREKVFGWGIFYFSTNIRNKHLKWIIDNFFEKDEKNNFFRCCQIMKIVPYKVSWRTRSLTSNSCLFCIDY